MYTENPLFSSILQRDTHIQIDKLALHITSKVPKLFATNFNTEFYSISFEITELRFESFEFAVFLSESIKAWIV